MNEERNRCDACGVELDNGEAYAHPTNLDLNCICGVCHGQALREREQIRFTERGGCKSEALSATITGTLNGQPVEVSPETVAKIERELKVRRP